MLSGLSGLVGWHPWIYPGLTVLHLVGLGALFGGLLILDLRLLGRASTLDPVTLARLAVPVALAGFALCLVTGGLMFAAHADEVWASRAFRVKLVLILIAGLNALWFHRRVALGRTGSPGPRGEAVPDRLALAQGLLSLALWIAVIACGRWIGVA